MTKNKLFGSALAVLTVFSVWFICTEQFDLPFVKDESVLALVIVFVLFTIPPVLSGFAAYFLFEADAKT